MLPLVRLEDEPKSGAIFAYFFISPTLTRKEFVYYLLIFLLKLNFIAFYIGTTC